MAFSRSTLHVFFCGRCEHIGRRFTTEAVPVSASQNCLKQRSQHRPAREIPEPSSHESAGKSKGSSQSSQSAIREDGEALLPGLENGGWVCIGPNGHWIGSPGIERYVVYVAMHNDCPQRTHSVQDFLKRIE
jgi:hypothetical protein